MLPDYEFDSAEIELIYDLIIATKMHNVNSRLIQKPKNHLERIICDADLDVLGRKDYGEKSDLLYFEFNSVGGYNITYIDWIERQINFLQNHTYFTETSRVTRGKGKERNVDMFKLKLESFKV